MKRRDILKSIAAAFVGCLLPIKFALASNKQNDITADVMIGYDDHNGNLVYDQYKKHDVDWFINILNEAVGKHPSAGYVAAVIQNHHTVCHVSWVQSHAYSTKDRICWIYHERDKEMKLIRWNKVYFDKS